MCVKYPEVERFSKFVYFYSDYISYIDAIKKAAFGTKIKYSIEEKNRFLESNTWSVRAKIVSKMIDKKMKK